MGKAWNHNIDLGGPLYTASENKLQYYQSRYDKAVRENDSEHIKWYACSVRGCDLRPEFRCTYDYVTGRAGRVSWAERCYCRVHAEKFAAKNGIQMPLATTSESA